MPRDQERIERICAALRQERLHAIVCSRSENVLMLTGYWPVIGASVGIVRDDGAVGALVPEDEHDLAVHGWIDHLVTYQPASLQDMRTTIGSMRQPLDDLCRKMGFAGKRIGFEGDSALEPASYLAVREFGPEMQNMLHAAAPGANLVSAGAMLAALRSRKTPAEVANIRHACRAARQAFEDGLQDSHLGLTEMETGHRFHAGLVQDILERQHHRADGFVFCMSGPNSANAYKAYQRSSNRKVQHGDSVLVHCNSYVHGFWTDITRTYCAGEITEELARYHAAIMEARAAAFAVIKPGAAARAVDLAARDVLARHGYGPQFLHPTGHGIGFGANDHSATPCLHPKSDHILQPGMVFNVEPGLYFANRAGLRHCDMVATTDTGMELLTDFQCGNDPLVLKPRH